MVYWSGLENRRWVTSAVGSNPTPSVPSQMQPIWIGAVSRPSARVFAFISSLPLLRGYPCPNEFRAENISMVSAWTSVA